MTRSAGATRWRRPATSHLPASSRSRSSRRAGRQGYSGTGRATVLDYLRPRLFEPLGIDNPTWEASPQGISAGGYGLSIRTGDIAKFGQLYLQKGKWEGKQLLPEAWVARATSLQTSNGSDPKSDW